MKETLKNYDPSIIKGKTTEELVKIYAQQSEYTSDFIEDVRTELVSVRHYNLDESKAKIDGIKRKRVELEDEEILYGQDVSPLGILVNIIFAWLLFPNYILAHKKSKNSKGEEFYKYCKTARNFGNALFYYSLFQYFLILLYVIKYLY